MVCVYNDHTDFLHVDKLASINRTHLAYPASPIQFRTFPDPRLASGNHFKFIVSSSITPNFPYLPHQTKSIKGFDLLAKYLFPKSKVQAAVPESVEKAVEELVNATAIDSDILSQILEEPEKIPAAEFLLLTGDSIRADKALSFGNESETYRRLYRRNYQTTYRKIYERLRE